MSPGRLRGREFAHPHWGIRSVAPPQSAREHARTFGPRLPERAFLFGITAAHVWGIPLPDRLRTSELHVGVRAGARRVEASGVRAHHVDLGDSDLTVRCRVRLTTIERTVCDLAASGLKLAEVVAAADFAIWRRHPLTTLGRLEAATALRGGQRGSRILRRAAELASDRSDSAPESELRVAIIEAGLPGPSVNIPVTDARGRFLAQPDLSWPAHLLALDYEGDHHRVERSQWHKDLERFARMQEHGWTVLRASAADYRDPRPLLARLHRILRSRRREST